MLEHYRSLTVAKSIETESVMHSIIYIVGVIVIVLAILSFLGLG